MSEEIKVDVKLKESSAKIDAEQNPTNHVYSVDMIDTMFADSLSRGMHNAIISQQNAQMASSASITSACARILQAATDKAVIEEKQKKKLSPGTEEQIEISIEKKSDCIEEPVKPKHWLSFYNLTPWLLIVLTFATFVIAVSYLQSEIEAANLVIEQQLEPKKSDINDESKDER